MYLWVYVCAYICARLNFVPGMKLYHHLVISILFLRELVLLKFKRQIFSVNDKILLQIELKVKAKPDSFSPSTSVDSHLGAVFLT